MTQNKIIPQMFDVKPVDETGDLNWQKIQSIGVAQFSQEQPQSKPQQTQFEKSVNAYILGIAIESKSAPILHDPTFNLQEYHEQILEQKKQTQELAQEIERQNLVRQQRKNELEQAQQRRILETQKEHERQIQITEQNRLFHEREEARRRQQQFVLEQQKRQEEILREEKVKKDQQRMRFLDNEKQRLLLQQEQISHRIKNLHQEKEEKLIAQRAKEEFERQQRILSEAQTHKKQLRKIAEFNRLQQQEYEAAVIEEREKREKEHSDFLMKAEIDRIKAEKRKARQNKAAKRNWFAAINKGSNPTQLKKTGFSWRELFFPERLVLQTSRSPLSAFVAVTLILSFFVGSVSYASKGLGLKGKVLGVSQDGYANLNSAVSDLAHQNFEGSTQQFDQAYANFSQASDDLQSMGGILLDSTKYFPYLSKISSGKNAVEAGKHFSAAGQSLNEIAKSVSAIKNPIDTSQANQPSLLDVLQLAEKNIASAKTELDAAQQNIDQISIDDLPKDKQDQFLLLKQKLPDIRSAMELFLNNSHILVDLLGGNGPRKYLFLFQNNSEMRATGGFIGSYGLLDIANGRVKKFFIDGIFNPDGQLRDKIVPPIPIQKISANWSLHDSNWFPDFPLSAQKAINFYEKTGGPTADGVITFTPEVMQKLLQITGPIDMPDYGVTLDADNFLELTQFKVEDDYDKENNQPKKILSDLAPLVLDKLLSSHDLDSITKTAQAILAGLQEKHILLYSQNDDIEKIIQQQGWSGEILPASKDYLSVINTNINGYKTDAIIDETIDHKAEVQSDGSIVDTVTITRKHNGGSTPYDWLNKVNADYMRVYVPQGSKLLEVSGQTREQDSPPVDYDALGFKRDPDVQSEEQNTTIDPESGTRIYTESGKTVFANWTYVSPQETMTITYKYLLPFSLFKVTVGNDAQQIDSYSLVAQKQSGSVGSKFVSHLSFPANYNPVWNSPQSAQKNATEIDNESDLKIDRFEGVVFEKK